MSGCCPGSLALLAPGGVLAVQMPDNAREPSHRLIRDIAASGPWRDGRVIAGGMGDKAVLAAEAYYDLLAPLAPTIDLWRTTCLHHTASPAAIVDCLRSTGLRPSLDPLAEPERAAFLALYEATIAEAYPPRADGTRFFAFPRLFIVARRA